MSGQEIQPAGKSHELTQETIKKYICPTATDQETYFFLQLCKAQNLNPFLKEVYLIKYGTAPATMVTGKETFTKRADRLPQYNGFKAGIILNINQQIQYREGSFIQQGELLLGGWAEIFRKDRDNSYRIEVTFSEYAGRKADGELNQQWKSKPATMIRKVALVQGLREAFPDEFASMYSEEENVPAVPQQEPHIERPIIPNIKASEAVPEAPHECEVTEPVQHLVTGDSTTPQHKAIHAILGKLGIVDDAKKHEHVSNILAWERVMTSFTEMTKKEASTVIDKLGKEEKAKNG